MKKKIYFIENILYFNILKLKYIIMDPTFGSMHSYSIAQLTFYLLKNMIF